MAKAEVELAIPCRATIGEGAVWSVEEQVLYWVDIPAGELHRFDPASGVDQFFQMPTPIGCFALTEEGGIIVALNNGFHHYDLESKQLRFIAQPEVDRPGNRFNDGTVDQQGRFLAGTMPMQGAREGEPKGSLYVLDRDQARTLGTGYWVVNGLAFSPDGRTMYDSDSHPDVRTIWAWDYDLSSGTPSNRRVFFDTREVAGRPDGGAMDVDGCYWMAGVGGWQLVRITPKGKVDRIVPMPVERPTRIAFGGANLDVMYITTIGEVGKDGNVDPRQPDAGAVFRLEAGVQGTPFPRYRGPA